MLRAMFSLDMKEKEASEIDVVDVSPETLAQMIEFMYTGNVDDLDERSDELLGESRICGDEAEQRGCGESLAGSTVLGGGGGGNFGG